MRKSALKHSAPYKPNQQINVNERKGKKRNDNGIPLNRPTWQAKSSADIYTSQVNVSFISLFVLFGNGKTLFKAGERSVLRGNHVRYQRLNLLVIPRQSTCDHLFVRRVR